MGMLRFWKISYLFLGIILLPIILVHCSDSDLQVNNALNNSSPLLATVNGTNNANEQKIGGDLSSDPTIAAPLKKQEQVENPKKVSQDDILKSNASNTLESKNGIGKVSEEISNVGFSNRDKDSNDHGGSIEGSNQVIVKEKESSNSAGLEEEEDSKQVIAEEKKSSNTRGSGGENSKQVNIDDNESGKTRASGEGSGSKQVPTEEASKGSSDSSEVLKEKLRNDECDPSNMCIDKKKNLTACLRVPGNDSPDLSLQIWNKGARPVTISITAPAFVQLEERKVQLQPKEDKKVKVSIAYEGMDSLIFLTTEDSRCILDFRELASHDLKVETQYALKLQYFNNWTKVHFIIFFICTIFLVFGCAWMYFGLHKKLIVGNGYEAVEMELPVSAATKTDSEKHGSWDDSWDDEEASMTPTLPTTPNPSSRGLASRRLNKEAWKD